MGQFAAEHHGDQALARQIGGGAGADELAVAQHGDTVADCIDLLEKMGDEDDAQAALLQVVDDAEEQRHFLIVETCGGLIEDQHLA